MSEAIDRLLALLDEVCGYPEDEDSTNDDELEGEA